MNAVSLHQLSDLSIFCFSIFQTLFLEARTDQFYVSDTPPINYSWESKLKVGFQWKEISLTKF